MLKRHIAVMFVPHSGSQRSYSFTVFVPIALILAIVMVGLLVFSVSYLASHKSRHQRLASLRALFRENEEQRLRIEAMRRETERLKEVVGKLAKLDAELKSLVDAGGDHDHRWDYGGVGGPSQDERSWLSSLSPADEDGGSELMDRIHDDMRELRIEVAIRERSLNEVKGVLEEQNRKRASTPSIWPLRGPITSGYGSRDDPFNEGIREFHEGVDISAPSGRPIVATADGEVIYAGWKEGYGLVVVIDHGYGYRTLYSHNGKIAVSVGGRVKRGDVISYSGSTGRSTGPHLHYEVIYNGKPQDPIPYFLD